jgi:hypothetical protein
MSRECKREEAKEANDELSCVWWRARLGEVALPGKKRNGYFDLAGFLLDSS